MAKLSVILGGDDRELRAALKRAKGGLRSFGREMRTGIQTSAKYAAAMTAVGVAIATHIVKQQMDAIDATAKMSRITGIVTEDFIAYRHAAELAGVDTATFDSNMTALIKRIGEARSGTGPLITFMKKYDETLLETLQSQTSNAGALALIADAIHNAATEADAAAIANAAFSRQGVAMAEVFRDQGAAALKEAREEVIALGLSFSDLDARQVEQANDAITTMRAAFRGVATQLSFEVSPIITAIADEFNRAAREGEGMAGSVSAAFDKMIAGTGFVLDAIEGIKRVFQVTARFIITEWTDAARELAETTLNILKAVDKIPFVDMSDSIESVQSDVDEFRSIVKQGREEIDAILAAPMPSVALKKFIEDARIAAEEAAKVAASTRSAAGATGGDDDETDKDALEKKLQQMRESFASEQELLFEQREKQLEDIREFEEQKLVTDIEAKRLREEVEQSHWDKIGEISEKATKAQIALEKAKNAAIRQDREKFMSNLAGLMNTESRKVFKIGKIAAMGQAGYKGGLAVMDAWEAGMSTGGPQAPFIAAAYATAAGLNAANLINNIRKQTFGGGGGTPRAPTQGSSNVSQQGAGGGQIGGTPTSILRVEGLDTGALFSGQQMRNLIERINEETENGSRIILA